MPIFWHFHVQFVDSICLTITHFRRKVIQTKKKNKYIKYIQQIT